MDLFFKSVFLLQYSFVTSLTSLVVVKPNDSHAVDTQDASQASSPYYGGAGTGFLASSKFYVS